MSSYIPTDKLDRLISTLKNNKYRVGIWLVPSNTLGTEAVSAIHLGASAVDLAKVYLEGLDEQARFSALAPDRLSDLLERVFSAGGNDLALGYNLDLLLTRLNSQQRAEFWDMALTSHPNPPRMLLLSLPANAYTLYPQGGALHLWKEAGKLLDEGAEKE